MDKLALALTLATVLHAVSMATSQQSHNASYEWRPGEWSGCEHRDARACCTCSRTRHVHCVLKQGGKRIPPFYCHKLRDQLPMEQEECRQCQQDCVLSMWGEWSACSDTCAPATRFRTRHVLLLPSGGGSECEPLLDIENCLDLHHCPYDNAVSRYSWKSGDWTSCRKNTTDGGDCGPGVRKREVYCQDKRGHRIADQFCLQYMPGQHKPETVRMCQIPCACTVSQWSTWSACSHSCVTHIPAWMNDTMDIGLLDVGTQARSRVVIEPGDDYALDCPHLAESRACLQGPSCPRYIWRTSDWSECHMSESGDGVTCGSGEQVRQVTCVMEGEEDTPLSQQLCYQERYPDLPAQKLRPPEQRACHVPCPLDCELGAWEPWSMCSQSCGQDGQQIRRRSVVQEAEAGGEQCAERFETRACPPAPCQLWHIAPWRPCMLADYRDTCGRGLQVRIVYCVSAVGEVLQDSDCSQDKPLIERACKVPCEEECTVGEWGEWSPCNQTCGFPGGMQTRTRQILTNNGPTACLEDRALTETQYCNQQDCARLNIWGVSGWSPCELSNSSVLCGREGSGVQRREVFCQADDGGSTTEASCNLASRPVAERTCSALCRRNCMRGPWSEWSTCDAPCGDTQRHRYRPVRRLAVNGGSPCEDANEDGMIIQSRECKRTQACEWYTWHVRAWGTCHSPSMCGKGVQHRGVTCHRNSEPTDTETCLDKMLGSRPAEQQACYKPCPADCSLSEWSEWGPCSQTCGRDGERTRTRALLHPMPGVAAEEQCPSLRRKHVLQTITCREAPCVMYAWDVGRWRDCVADSSTGCGPGIQRRHVFCRSVEQDGVYTSNDKCSVMTSMPERYQACEQPCQVDCQVGNWGSWGPCSALCGMGLQTRDRAVVTHAYSGGALCPDLSQTRTCSARACDDFIWHTGDWSQCEPNHNLPCGRGLMSREVTCPAGVDFIGECERRMLKPPVSELCYEPCAGDCELSEWSEWSQCDCSTHTDRQTRIRRVLALPRDGGRECESTREERDCDCPDYRLSLGNWSRCLFNGTQECGDGGTRERQVTCMRVHDSVQMPLHYCTRGDVTTHEPCSRACPRHCELSSWNEWSSCSATCGMDALRIRERRVLRRNNRHGGRQCPPQAELRQFSTCDSSACYEYTWHERDWSTCSVNITEQCGVGSQTRRTVCMRRDGFEVDKLFCGQTEEEVVLRQEAPCGESCPGDCMLSQWSAWGPCYTDCRDTQGRGFQIRSRTIIAPAEGGKPCPDDWVEKRVCRRDTATCPLFFWEAKEWDYSDRRRVYCRTAGEDEKVFGGCVDSQKPARRLECTPTCGKYANCLEGSCVCQDGFLGDGNICLPEFGCHSNNHCIANHSFCDVINKECLCHNGKLPSHDMVCPVHALPAREVGGSPVRSWLLYALIGCLAVLVVIGIILAVCVASRFRGKKKARRDAAKHPPTLAKIDNLDTMKNNESHARSRNLHEIPDSSYRTNKSDKSEVSDLRLATVGYQKDSGPGVITMPTYYAKSVHPPQGYGMNEVPKSAHGSKVSGLNHADTPTGRLMRESPLPYITIPARSTPTPQDTQLKSFKPADRDRSHTPLAPISPIRAEPSEDMILPHLSVATQLPPGIRPLTDPVANGTPNGSRLLQAPQGDKPKTHSPRHNRYGDGPYTRNKTPGSPHKIPGSPHLKAMAPLPENSLLQRHKHGRPLGIPNQRQAHEPTNQVPPYIEPLEYKRPQPYSNGNDSMPESPKLRTPSFSPPGGKYNSSPMGKYNSLPRHGASALPKRDIHSDVEQSEPLPNGSAQTYNKYGSLPTKGRRQAAMKGDAAQNLLEYCDALLADLEQAATS